MTTAFAGLGSRSSLLTVADLFRGVTYKKDEARTQPALGLLPILRATNLQNGQLVFDDLVYVPTTRVSDVQRIRKGDIVIAMSSGSREVVGKAALVTTDWEGGFGAFCGVLRAKPGTNPELLSHFLQSPVYRAAIEQVATGTNINNLSKTTLAAIAVPLPPPEAQEQLARLLSELDGSRRSSSGHLSIAARAIDHFRHAVLAAACSGRLTAEWREAHPNQQAMLDVLLDREGARSPKRRRAITDFDPSDLPELPSAWVWAPLAAVSSSVLGKMLDRAKNKGDPRPYLRNTNVRWRGFDLHDVQEMRFQAGEEEERYGLKPGDVLVCEGGEPGRAAVWRDARTDMRFQKAIHRVRCDHALLPDWLVNVLQAYALSGVLSRYLTGSGIAHLTGVSLARVLVPLPPIEEQREIVRRVDQLLAEADGLGHRINLALVRIERSSQAVLAKAFRAELMLGNGGDP